MRVTKSRMARLIKEELSKAQQKLDLDDDGEIEGSDLAGMRKGKKDKDVGSDKKNESIARLVQEEYSKYLNEGNEASKLIDALGKVGDALEGALGNMSDDPADAEAVMKGMPETMKVLQAANEQVQQIWEAMHDMRGVNEETKPHEADRHPTDTPEDRIRK